ncbi:carbohydrate ABC transporter permease [Actinophytocola gossypii]|uniref:Sugar ABC transporter permease n=1 Tax=Actinophytocola gossypii TaxID=2812003 RepID=A0ABT2J1Y7_9PSEU|nr:sugar ABC transporter permease [Actinophytocola gossypii]MCT2581614.1 sugar ABC transporter permease [Actinophytocola gossypii]
MALLTKAPPRPPAAPPGRARRRDRGYLPYLIPGVLLFVVVIAIPLGMNVAISFTEWQGVGSPDWVGLEQYRTLFADETFWISFRNNLALIVAMAVVPTFLGLLLATALFDVVSKRHPRTTSTLRAAFYLPQVLPAVVAGVVWGWILHPEYGSANALLRFLGLDSWTQNWLGDENTALLSVMAVLVWIQLGYPLVIFMAGLQRVDPELYEAAELDGASWWQRLWSVTVPQIRPEVFVVLLTCTIAALKSFDKIFVLTRGGPGGSTNTPSYFSFQNFFEKANVGYGAAIATVLTAIIVGLTFLFLRAQSRREP